MFCWRRTITWFRLYRTQYKLNIILTYYKLNEFCLFSIFEKLDVLLASLKFLTSLLLLTLTVVTSVPAVAVYLLFQASCCSSLLLQEPCYCKATYLAVLLLLASLLCELWFLLLQDSRCCRCPAVARVLLLQEPYSPAGPCILGSANQIYKGY